VERGVCCCEFGDGIAGIGSADEDELRHFEAVPLELIRKAGYRGKVRRTSPVFNPSSARCSRAFAVAAVVGTHERCVQVADDRRHLAAVDGAAESDDQWARLPLSRRHEPKIDAKEWPTAAGLRIGSGDGEERDGCK
jgi:hypothetical protein